MSPDAVVLATALLADAPLLGELDGPVVVACSGGADSVGLLLLACHAGLDTTAVHVDHGLRPDSAADADVVAAIAASVGADAVSVRVVVEPGPNVEARARDARFAALHEQADTLGARHIAVAHTLDDQAETLLLAVLRGSGTPGLAGMAARRGAIVRPLLGVRRNALRALVDAAGVVALDDPMNHDDAFLRVWVRSTLLPLLAQRSGRDLAPVLARQTALVRAESEFLDRLAADALRTAGDPPTARALAELDHVVLRRVVRMLCGSPPIGGPVVDAAVGVVVGTATAVDLPGGRTLRRRAGRLVVEPST